MLNIEIKPNLLTRILSTLPYIFSFQIRHHQQQIYKRYPKQCSLDLKINESSASLAKKNTQIVVLVKIPFTDNKHKHLTAHTNIRPEKLLLTDRINAHKHHQNNNNKAHWENIENRTWHIPGNIQVSQQLHILVAPSPKENKQQNTTRTMPIGFTTE